jgi:hypothetical protein
MPNTGILSGIIFLWKLFRWVLLLKDTGWQTSKIKKNMKSTMIFLSGVGLGVVLGLLFAPEPGRVTLLKVRTEADRIVDKVLQKERLNRQVQHAEESVVSAS